MSETAPQAPGSRPPGWHPAARAALWIAAGAAALALIGIVSVASLFGVLRVERRGNVVEVPKLLGMTVEQARASVGPAELVVEVLPERRHDPSVPSDRILVQDPAPGASVKRGRKVRVTLSLGGEVLAVPDLAGQAGRAVAITLRQQGFGSGDEAWAPSRAAPSGTVIAQVPPPGAPAVPGTRVHRLLSAGAPPVRWVMPDLSGRTREEAERWLSATGFRPAPVRRVPAPGKAPGTVVGQRPPAGYPVESRAVVELTVAEGGR